MSVATTESKKKTTQLSIHHQSWTDRLQSKVLNTIQDMIVQQIGRRDRLLLILLKFHQRISKIVKDIAQGKKTGRNDQDQSLKEAAELDIILIEDRTVRKI